MWLLHIICGDWRLFVIIADHFGNFMWLSNTICDYYTFIFGYSGCDYCTSWLFRLTMIS